MEVVVFVDGCGYVWRLWWWESCVNCVANGMVVNRFDFWMQEVIVLLIDVCNGVWERIVMLKYDYVCVYDGWMKVILINLIMLTTSCTQYV